MRPSYLRPITKASNGSHFHIALNFSFSILLASIRDFFTFFTFSVLEIKINAFSVELLYHKDSDMFRPLNKIKPVRRGSYLDWWPYTNTLCCQDNFFFFFPYPFPRQYLRLQNSQPRAMSFLLFIKLFLITPCPFLGVFIYVPVALKFI